MEQTEAPVPAGERSRGAGVSRTELGLRTALRFTGWRCAAPDPLPQKSREPGLHDHRRTVQLRWRDAHLPRARLGAHDPARTWFVRALRDGLCRPLLPDDARGSLRVRRAQQRRTELRADGGVD